MQVKLLTWLRGLGGKHKSKSPGVGRAENGLSDQQIALGANGKNSSDSLLVHPQNQKPIELALEAGGYKFYEFTSYLDMPVVRWERLAIMEEEFSRGITRGGLDIFLKEIKSALNPIEGEVVDLDRATKLLNELEYRNDNIYDIELMYQLLSASLFTLEEDIYSYDVDLALKKIKIFKALKGGFENEFFQKKSVSEIMPSAILLEDIPSFLKSQEVLMKVFKERSTLGSL